MSEVDPDIQMPEEEPNTPEDQSLPPTPDETPDTDAEGTLENIQELIDQIDSLSKESDDEALNEIENQLPQNQEPEEEESKSEALIVSDIAALDDDLALILDDIDQVVVQAESETSDSSAGESPVSDDAVNKTAHEALSSQKEHSSQEGFERESGGIEEDTDESGDAFVAGDAAGAGGAGEVGDSAGLDTDVDEIVSKIETLDAMAAPSHASEPGSTEAESVEEVEDTSREAEIEAVTDQALNPSPEELESISEGSTPAELVENETPPEIGEIAAPGGEESSIDLSSEINDLLAQAKTEQPTKPLERTTKPVTPAPKINTAAPTGEESEINDLNNDLDDLVASAQEQPASDEKSESSESPAPAEAIVSIPPETVQSPDVAGEAIPAESEEPKATPVREEQKKEAPPTASEPHSNVPMTPQNASMRALDEAMADDVAQMIAGDSEALESVLDGIFDEQAILVQYDEEFKNDSDLDVNKQSENPVGDSGEKSSSPSDFPMDTAGDIGEVIDEEIAAFESPETENEISTTSVMDKPETDQKSIDQAVQKPDEATKVADVAEVETMSSEPQLASSELENNWQERVMAAFEIIEPPLVTVLSGLNYPLRKIPERLRPAVDWLALSLVFWVPIVWVLAMFVV